jgi:hypothetical protein
VEINWEKEKGYLLSRLVCCDSNTKNLNIKIKSFSQSWSTKNAFGSQRTNKPPPPKKKKKKTHIHKSKVQKEI